MARILRVRLPTPTYQGKGYTDGLGIRRMNRRQAITTAVGVSIGLAGCTWNQSRTVGVELTIFNQADAPFTVEVGFFGDGASEAEARAYDTTVDIESGGQQTHEAVVEPDRYVIRYHAYENNSRLTDEDHVHYIPDGDGTESLAFDIGESGELSQR